MVQVPMPCRRRVRRSHAAATVAFGLMGPLAGASALAQTSAEGVPWRIDLEYQRFNVQANFAQRPNDASGTRFSVNEFASDTGNSFWIAAYGQMDWFVPKDEIRLVIAPFEQSGTGIPNSVILYDGGTFVPGVPLTVKYKFNTYRVTYDVPVFSSTQANGWTFRMGGTLAIRDAQIKLSQGQQVRNFTNVGPVPLFYASMVGKLGQDWRLLGEIDAFPAPGGGGLYDGSLKLTYNLTRDFALTLGARYEAGGATDPEIYNSLRLWSATVGVSYSF
jgi:hypothetical protein